MPIGNVLADTSALIEYFLGNPSFVFMKEFLREKTLLVNDIVRTEFLPHAIKAEEYMFAAEVNSIRRTAMNTDWEEILKCRIAMFKDGYRKIGIQDLLIAQNCVQNDVPLITHDGHFETIAKFLPLKLYGCSFA